MSHDFVPESENGTLNSVIVYSFFAKAFLDIDTLIKYFKNGTLLNPLLTSHYLSASHFSHLGGDFSY